MVKALAWFALLVFCGVAWAEPPEYSIHLDEKNVQTGDLIGLSARKEVVGFIIQAVTESPIEHVGVASRESDGVYVYHWTKNEGPHKLPLATYLARYRGSDGVTTYVQGRPNPPLTADQVGQLQARLQKLAPTVWTQPTLPGRPKVKAEGAPEFATCTDFTRATLADVGIKAGEVKSFADFPKGTFGGMPDQVRESYYSTSTFVPTASLFRGSMRVVRHNSPGDPLTWTESQQLAAWERNGDLSALSSIYWMRFLGGATMSAEEKKEKLLAFLRHSVACPLNKLKEPPSKPRTP